MMDELYDLIKKYEYTGHFTYTEVTDSMINQAEEQLGLKLPEQFIWFLKTFGYGGILGICIMGVGLTGRMIFVDETLEYRTHGLPKEFITIENCDEWQYCINSVDGTIVSWCMWEPENIILAYNDFKDYLMDRIQYSLEDYLYQLEIEQGGSKADS